MADITMCSGEGCPRKKQCYRYTAPKSNFWQSYFAKVPLRKDKKGKITCEFFWKDERPQKTRP